MSSDTIVVGASRCYDQGAFAGAVYVFELRSGAWVMASKLLSSDGEAFDFFGENLDLDLERIVVGAPNSGGTPGAAYVFDRQPIGWMQTAKLEASDGAANDGFGRDVAVHGDSILVGAPYKDEPSLWDPGAAYAFDLRGARWVETKLLPDHRDHADYFGYSVALMEGLSVVGARGALAGLGRAVAFQRQGPGWIQVAGFQASDGVAGDALGSAVAMSGPDVLVGAPMANSTGAGYLFQFDAPLSADRHSISSSAGGVQRFSVDFGANHAGDPYFLLGSVSGSFPGVVVGETQVPLRPDAYLTSTLRSPNRPPLHGSFGALDLAGSASATFSLPRGASHLAGVTAHHAAVVLDPSTGTVLRASNPVILRITD
jgi:hypothetical protein